MMERYFKTFEGKVLTAFLGENYIDIELWKRGDVKISMGTYSSSRLERLEMEGEESTKEEFNNAFLEANIRITNIIQ